MKTAAWAVAAMLVLSLTGCAQSPVSGTIRQGFELDNFGRSYLLHVPPAQSGFAGALPLVLVLHGGGESGESLMAMTRNRFDALADQFGFVVAYPDAVDGQWDFGEGLSSSQLSRHVDDLGFFARLIDEIAAQTPIDGKRIFVAGHSRGGMAAYFLACKLPGRIRAIAPVSMSMPSFIEDDCAGAPPFGFALLNGTADPFMPYEGGNIVAFGQTRDAVLSTEATLAIMRQRNGCSEAPATTAIIDKPGDPTAVTRRDWSSCASAPVLNYRIDNGGHTWPSGTRLQPVQVIGEISHEIDAADEIWAFFSRFP